MLFDALQWPVNIDEWVEYLEGFSKWAPQQSKDPAWATIDGNGHQEAYDRLGHFYWLIDQPLTSEEGTLAEVVPGFPAN
jgi:phosphatidylserine decarboxylase